MRLSNLLAPVAIGCLLAGSALATEPTDKVVRIAQLVIDPAQLAAYQAAVKEEMADSVRLEPGVLSIYSVAQKDQPNRLHFFEIYANEAAYQSHIASAHFQKYVATTQSMIVSKVLLETEPVQLSTQVQAVASPAYYVAEFEVTDPQGMKPYSAQVESTFKPYGGHFIVRGGKTISLEGKAPERRRVVIEFASVEKAQAWYNSAAYTELRKIRQRSAKTDVYLIEGVVPR